MNNFETDSFDPEVGAQQILSLHVKMDLGVMVRMEYSTFPRTGASPSDAV